MPSGPSSARSCRPRPSAAARLVACGEEAVILGCTEIMRLVRPEDSAVPLFDPKALHAEAAVELALSRA